MAMDILLKKLEERIEQILEAHQNSKKNEETLQARVAELESQTVDLESRLQEGSEAADRARELEGQRGEMTGRLEKVISLIDGVLQEHESVDGK